MLFARGNFDFDDDKSSEHPAQFSHFRLCILSRSSCDGNLKCAVVWDAVHMLLFSPDTATTAFHRISYIGMRLLGDRRSSCSGSADCSSHGHAWHASRQRTIFFFRHRKKVSQRAKIDQRARAARIILLPLSTTPMCSAEQVDTISIPDNYIFDDKCTLKSRNRSTNSRDLAQLNRPILVYISPQLTAFASL